MSAEDNENTQNTETKTQELETKIGLIGLIITIVFGSLAIYYQIPLIG